MCGKILFIAPGLASESAVRAAALRDACSTEYEEAILLLISSDNGNALLRVKEWDYVWHKPQSDPFFLENYNGKLTSDSFSAFLKAMRPDIAHIQLDSGLELDLLQMISATLPDARIIVNIQSFEPVCPSGWLIMPSGIQCPSPIFSNCSMCCPDYDNAAKWLRARRNKHYLELADAIITPTGWQQNIYIKWGLNPETLYIIPNFIGPIFQMDAQDSPRTRFGFIGEAAPHSGLHVLLEAIGTIPEKERKKATFHIYANGLERQDTDYIKEIEGRITQYGAEGIMTWTNSFPAADTEKAMAGFDWLVLPYIGASGSPLALDTAIALRKPVICTKNGEIASRLGGNPDQLRHCAGSVGELATNLKNAVGNRNLWEKASGLLPPAARNEVLKAHLRLIRNSEEAWT